MVLSTPVIKYTLSRCLGVCTNESQLKLIPNMHSLSNRLKRIVWALSLLYCTLELVFL